MLRNPVERAYSHYRMSLRRRRETHPFAHAIDREPQRLQNERRQLGVEPAFAAGQSHRNHSYLTRGHYAEQLERWFAHFPREHILVVESEQFFANPAQIHADTLRFLELPHQPLRQYRNLNGWDRSAGASAVREQLETYFAPHNARLEQLLGCSFWKYPDAVVA